MKKVITYGSFALFHKRHYNLLKSTKEHGDYLIVRITAEQYDVLGGSLMSLILRSGTLLPRFFLLVSLHPSTFREYSLFEKRK